MKKRIYITLISLFAFVFLLDLTNLHAAEFESKAMYKLQKTYGKVNVIDIDTDDRIFSMDDDTFKQYYKEVVGTSYISDITKITSENMSKIFNKYVKLEIDEFKQFYTNEKISYTVGESGVSGTQKLFTSSTTLSTNQDGKYDSFGYWLYMYYQLYREVTVRMATAVNGNTQYNYDTFANNTKLVAGARSNNIVSVAESNRLETQYETKRNEMLLLLKAYNVLCKEVSMDGYSKVVITADTVTVGTNNPVEIKREWFELGDGFKYVIDNEYIKTSHMGTILYNFYQEKYSDFIDEYKSLNIRIVIDDSYVDQKVTVVSEPSPLQPNEDGKYWAKEYWTYMYYKLYKNINMLTFKVQSGTNFSPEEFNYNTQRESSYEMNVVHKNNTLVYDLDSINKISSLYDSYRTNWYEFSKLYDEYGEKFLGHPEDPVIDNSTQDIIPDEGNKNNSNLSVEAQCGDDWWGCAFDFLNKGQSSDVNTEIPGMLSELQSLVFDIGNIIFIVVTAFLGVKYIWGGVDSKYSVKNSLVTLVVAAIVFYGWNAVTDILNVKELLTEQSAGGYTNFATTIYNTIMYIVNVAAIGGIIYIGIKYMMAGADGKAEMKLKFIPVIMGIIMVYGTLNLINFILDIVYTF